MNTLIVGHVTHDRYEGGIVAGGCAFYGAKVHRALGGPTVLATVVGEDFRCREAIAELETVLERRGETTTFANYYPEDGPRRQLLEGLAPEVGPRLVEQTDFEPDVVHLAPVCGEVDLEQWTAGSGDRLVAINVQGWLKQPGELVDPAHFEQMQSRGVSPPARRVVETPWGVGTDQLEQVDVACLSEEDLLGQTDLLERLVDAVAVVALTRGAEGSRIYVDGEPTEVGIYPADLEDPTGAGDAFAAAFVHQLAAGLEPVEAARWGAAAASVIVEGPGPAAADRLDTVERRVRNVGIRDRSKPPN